MIEWQSTLRIKSDFYTDTLSLIEKFEKWKLENTRKKRRDLTKKDAKEYRGKTKEPKLFFRDSCLYCGKYLLHFL